ncbi:hypothetical protein ACQUJS_03050 [Ralstonia pseudosolanacearum]|uniref:Uncharacterized protein n=1 Tax=Ralstonia solanacearum TaxID=305 RepID=A0A0S4TXB3_RALSL|nr:hypothetical protein RSP799_07125 [Ralstonia solanacearum]CUV14656.1 conserved protein of unknown function [Ralstonia solanacearum]
MSNKFKVGDKVIVKPGQEGGLYNKYAAEAGKTYTITSITGAGSLRFAEKATPWGFDTLPPAHDPARFELAAQQPSRKFKVGDRVRLLEPVTSNSLTAGQVYTVRALRDSSHPPHQGVYLEGFNGEYDWWYEYRFELVPEAPRDFRLMCKGVLPRSFATPESASEHARKVFNDGEDFSVVEVVLVSKHTVRKVVEARA